MYVKGNSFGKSAATSLDRFRFNAAHRMDSDADICVFIIFASIFRRFI